MEDILNFLKRIDKTLNRTLDKAAALLWWVGQEDPSKALAASEICVLVEKLGHPKQNVSRLESQMGSDSRFVKCGKQWRLHPRVRGMLDEEYSFALTPAPLPTSNSVVPMDLFYKKPFYLGKIADQLNKAYDVQLFDCATVMARRLLETLLIEVYEKHGRANEIKGADGNFFMLNGLVTYFENDSSFHPGRNALRGLKACKTLGDLSAHARRFIARANDVDRVRDELRVTCEELIHLAGL